MESRTKCQFVVVTFGETTASLTFDTHNTVKIGTKIAASDEKIDHSADITKLCKKPQTSPRENQENQ
jgi:hypothetical protein